MTMTEMHCGDAHAGCYAVGWVASMLLHGSLVLGAVFFVQHVHLAPQVDVFKWDVTLVSSVSSSMPSSPPASPAESPPTTQPSTPETIHQKHPTPPASEPIQSESRKSRPPMTAATAIPVSPLLLESHTVNPVPQTIMPTPPEAVKPADPVSPVSAPAPIVPSSSVDSINHTPTPVESVDPSHQIAHSETARALPEKESDSRALATPTHPEPPTPILPMATASPETVPSTTPHATPSPSEPSVQAASSAAQVAALAPVGANSPARADYGWLSEVILRRVEELKHYPAEARADHAEGKVVVKAVINEDGGVENVEVFQSSGSATLDKAAVDLMRRAAPFSLPHSLEKPRVTVKIPMNYRLDR